MAVAGRSTGPVLRARTSAPGFGAISSHRLLGAILGLGAVVRFSTLGQQSLWYDEAVTRGIVAHGLGHVLSTVPRTESTPYLYYVVLWLWTRLFGLSEAGLRSFSALCGLLTVGVLYAAGRRLISPRAGLIAALLAAVNPLLFWYSQEARSYALLLLLCTVTVLTLARVLELPSPRRVLVWGLSCALALAAHYYAAVLIATEVVALAVVLHRRGRLDRRRIILGVAPVLVIGAALLPLLVHQNDGRAGYIASQDGSLAYRLAQLFKEDLIGMGQPVKALLTALGAGLVLIGLGGLLRRGRAAAGGAVGLLLAIGLGAIGLALVVAIVGTDYFNTRNLLPTWGPLFLVVAAGLAALHRRWVAAGAVGGLVVLSLFCVGTIVADPLYQRPDWRGAAQAIGAAPGQPRAIVADVQSPIPLGAYLNRLHVAPADTLAVREVDLIWLERDHQWGPLRPLHPGALPGFAAMQVTRTSAYEVVRYRASAAVPESAASLDRLYPDPARALALLQDPRPR